VVILPLVGVDEVRDSLHRQPVRTGEDNQKATFEKGLVAMEFLFLLAFFLVLAAFSMRGWVADSREGRDWRYAGRTAGDLDRHMP
jgi:hypothetical protein